MIKVIILSDNIGESITKISGTKDDKFIVMGEKSATIPLSLVQVFMEKGCELIELDDANTMKIAFELGKLSAQGEIEVYTEIKELNDLFNKKQVKNVRSKKAVSKQKAEKQEETFPMNKPEESAEEKPQKIQEPKRIKVKQPKENKETYRSAADNTELFSSIKSETVEKILKKKGYDSKYVGDIMDGLKMTNSEINLSLMLRTRIAINEEDKEKCKEIAEAVSEEILKGIKK